MATSMKCDNILIMNNSCNWFGRTQEDTRLHPAIIIMHTGVSLTNNILVFSSASKSCIRITSEGS